MGPRKLHESVLARKSGLLNKRCITQAWGILFLSDVSSISLSGFIARRINDQHPKNPHRHFTSATDQWKSGAVWRSDRTAQSASSPLFNTVNHRPRQRQRDAREKKILGSIPIGFLCREMRHSRHWNSFLQRLLSNRFLFLHRVQVCDHL